MMFSKKLRPSVYVVPDRDADGVDGRLVAHGDRNSHVAEEYRMLQTHLYSLTGDKKLKTIMITSSDSRDGKTLTCCNLAITLSCDPHKRVVMVDCDIRNPTVHRLLNIQQNPGVSEILCGKCALSDITKKPAIDNLFVVPAGGENIHPSELLRGPGVKELINNLRSSFDYVIIDTPPTLPASDSRIIGALCDMTILVVRFDKTSKG